MISCHLPSPCNTVLKRVLCLLSIALMVGIAACGDDSVSVDDRFLGNWRYQRLNKHRIMTFLANGGWRGEVRLEGRLAKIIEKREKVNGTWDVKDNVLHIVPSETSETGGWVAGKPVQFEILEISEDTLKIRSSELGVERYHRIRSQRADKEESKFATIGLAPIVANLMPDRASMVSRYLCVELEFTMDNVDPLDPDVPIHPKVREAALFHLSSLHYSDVNTMEKVQAVTKDLYRLVRPYMGPDLVTVGIKNIVVTARWKSVEAFIDAYEEEQVAKRKAEAEADS